MKRNWILILIALLLLALIAASYFLYARYNRTKSISDTQGPANPTQVEHSETSQSAMPQSNPSPTLAYPMNDFSKRITANDFGQYWPPGGTTNPDIKVCPNAAYYAGYHSANDLEIFANEQNADVPVYAVAAGTVKQAGSVSGYGGLIVLESKINEQVYTIYYGHVDLATKTVSAGDTVAVNQKLAELAPSCSTASGDARKHLHFGIRAGKEIDVRGYLSNQSDLNDWINPYILLNQNYASDPISN